MIQVASCAVRGPFARFATASATARMPPIRVMRAISAPITSTCIIIPAFQRSARVEMKYSVEPKNAPPMAPRMSPPRRASIHAPESTPRNSERITFLVRNARSSARIGGISVQIPRISAYSAAEPPSGAAPTRPVASGIAKAAITTIRAMISTIFDFSIRTHLRVILPE